MMEGYSGNIDDLRRNYPHQTCLIFPDFYGRLAWCKKQFGDNGERCIFADNWYHFTNEADLNWFLLRWA